MPASSEIPPAPENVTDAKAYLAWITDQAARGNMDGGTARDVASVVRIFIVAAEKVDIAGDIEDVRAQLRELKGGAA